LTNDGNISVYSAGKFNIQVYTYDLDATVTNNGTFDAYGDDVEVTLEGNTDDGEGIATLTNTGTLSIRDGATMNIKAAAEVILEEGSETYVYSSYDDSVVTVEEEGLVSNNAGTIYLQSGGEFAIEGRLESLDGNVCQSGGLFLIAETGSFRNGGG